MKCLLAMRRTGFGQSAVVEMDPPPVPGRGGRPIGRLQVLRRWRSCIDHPFSWGAHCTAWSGVPTCGRLSFPAVPTLRRLRMHHHTKFPIWLPTWPQITAGQAMEWHPARHAPEDPRLFIAGTMADLARGGGQRLAARDPGAQLSLNTPPQRALRAHSRMQGSQEVRRVQHSQAGAGGEVRVPVRSVRGEHPA